MRGDQLKRLLNLDKATLNFDYGNLFLESIVQASIYQEKPIGKIRFHIGAVTDLPRRNNFP
jgi:hypothetical protein